MYYQDSNTKFLREVSDSNVYSERSFAVVENPGCIAVLVEQCFISNQVDLDSFGTAAGCEIAAQCYYQAIVKYFAAWEQSQTNH